MTHATFARWLGLGLLAGAVLPFGANAQISDSTRAGRDTLARRDTSVVPLPPQPSPDTLEAPIARAPMPVLIEAGDAYRWDFESMLAAGVVTLQDLLDRIPGVTGLRAGWIGAPMVTAYLGNPGRVRLFFDGIELDVLDPRSGRAPDLTQIPIWAIEDLRVERGASELRLYMRSWSVERRRPFTRTDVSTGDQQTNLYRGYFGRRYGHGELLQFAAQQFGTSPARSLPSSDQLGLLGRLGWAAGGWSVDAFAFRNGRHRGDVVSVNQVSTIPGVESTRIDAYIRAGYGEVEHGLWGQGIASFAHYDFTGRLTPPVDTVNPPSPDSSNFRAQYVAMAGFSGAGFRLTGTERVRVFDRHTVQTPSVRAGYESRYLAVNAFLEGKETDSVSRAELGVRLSPLPFISLSGSAERRIDDRFTGDARNSQALRGEAGLRVGKLWLLGGVLRRDSTILAPPTIFADTLVPIADPARTGVYAGIRGTIYGPIKADVMAIRWSDTTGFYRPRYQTRSELYLQTNWLSRFPSGDFGIYASVVHEYRSNTRYPSESGVSTAIGSRVITTLLEIRILRAVAFWQLRNAMREPYALVPGYFMPRQIQLYGVRWQFWD